MKSSGLDELRLQRIREERKLYLEDFWLFATELLGYKDIQEEPHREVFNLLLSPSKRKLFLLPRGSFKSTILSISYTLWVLARNPDLRILLDSRKVDRSKTFLSEIKDHLLKNVRFREIFGDWKDIPGWRETSIVLPQRTAPHKEPSIQCAGIDAPVTGGHYDLILVDDLHDETNSITEIQLNKAIFHYQSLEPILEPDGTLIVIGTRWHYQDTYNHILEENAKSNRWETLVRAVYNPDNTLWFPTRLNEEFLEDKRRSLSPWFYASQYLLAPVPDELRRFKKEHIKYVDCQLVFSEGRAFVSTSRHAGLTPVHVTTTIDPAISQKKSADFTGIVTVATDPLDVWYVLAARRVQGGADRILDEIIKEIREWSVGVVGIESIAFQKALKEFLEYRLEDEDMMVQTKELISGTGRSKRARIEGLVPKFVKGEIIFRQGLGPELESEMLMWTPGQEMRHDDLIDALSHQLTIAMPASPFGGRTLAVDYFDLPPEERQARRRQKEEAIYERHRPSTGY